jgi:hypothetical protein
MLPLNWDDAAFPNMCKAINLSIPSNQTRVEHLLVSIYFDLIAKIITDFF